METFVRLLLGIIKSNFKIEQITYRSKFDSVVYFKLSCPFYSIVISWLKMYIPIVESLFESIITKHNHDEKGHFKSHFVLIAIFTIAFLIFSFCLNFYQNNTLDLIGSDDYANSGISQSALGNDFTTEPWIYPESEAIYRSIGDITGFFY